MARGRRRAPVSFSRRSVAIDSPSNAPLVGEPGSRRSGARGYKILVVDDDPDVLTLIRAALGQAGFKVTCLADLGQARRALMEYRYDLVLTDLYLGEESLGYEIAETARALRRPIPVIVITGRPSLRNAHEAVRSRVCEFVVKPVDAVSLVSACKRAIEEWEIRRRNEALHAQNRVLAQVLPRAIEAKDPTTKGHSVRVVQYADALASRCGVAPADREALRVASLLHDVGKVGIPNDILCKRGPLTAEERRVVERHPAIGYEILEPLEHSEKVRLWVYQHHERWDGRGYPNGLRGDEVDLPGRILILAEVFDALAEARSYKAAWTNARIVDFFRSQAGKHFDPHLAHLVADGLAAQGRRFFRTARGRLF